MSLAGPLTVYEPSPNSWPCSLQLFDACGALLSETYLGRLGFRMRGRELAFETIEPSGEKVVVPWEAERFEVVDTTTRKPLFSGDRDALFGAFGMGPIL